MLRISTAEQSEDSVLLRVEGRLVSQWADELERQCACWLSSVQEVRLDLSGVTLVDRHAARVLRALLARPIRVVRISQLIADFLGEENAP